MDFSFSEEQEAVRALAAQIFSDQATHERLLELEGSGEWFDMDLWSQLSEANLTSLVIPEAQGGGGMGMLELCAMLEEQGRRVAPVPLFATVVLGSLPIAAFGDDAQQDRWLRPVVDDGAVLSAALLELGGGDPARPRLTARREDGGWRLDGQKECVPALHLARGVLVPARCGDGVGVFIVDPSGPGVSVELQVMTHGEPQGRLVLDGAHVSDEALLGDPASGAEIVAWMLERAQLGLAALQLGVAQGALRDTAAYVSTRKQFDRPIATFQGVALRAADAFIDVEAMRGVLEQAAWRLEEGLPATTDVAAAKWWASLAGHRVVHTAQHLHGGTGADIEYPIHRYFYWSKQNGLLFGGSGQHAAEIGEKLVARSRAAASA